MAEYVDLHIHTTFSDGSLTPAEVVWRAVDLGLAAIAITDHDGVDGNAEAFAEGAQNGLEVITGVEISCDFTPANVHVVGLFIDPTNEGLAEALADVREYRKRRNPKILAKLAELGMAIDLEEVAAKAKGKTIGRPHIAEVMVDKAYVADFQEAFEKYLAHNKPAYVPRRRISAEEGVDLIHGAGGLAFLAHPGVYALPPRILENVVFKLARVGLDGVEVYYSDHLPTDTAFLKRLVDEYDLLAGGGTDFHGAAKPGVEVGIGRGDLKIPYELVARMKARLGARARRSAIR
ncbi:MAG: PHP domain-containing protein [candidate division Zixibacteria bacterium]|nr:PHP domain-containing protein [candidate division Zixibacteria bacterium]